MFKALTLSTVLGGALLMAGGAALSQPAGDPAHGEDVAKQRCVRCHDVGSYSGDTSGPSLNGVVGRKAGSVADFDYSPAMKGFGMDWTPAQLDAFLTDPNTAVPGTFMRVRVGDPKERADLIAYLSTLKAQ